MRKFLSKRWVRVVFCVLVMALALSAWLAGPTTWRLAMAWMADKPMHQDLPKGYTDDASRMNTTRVAQVVPVAREPAQAQAQIRQLLQQARKEQLKISIAGARHSMGGHTIYPDGIVLDMLLFDAMELDTEKKILRVGAGARWSQVIPYLNDRGMAVWVMQSFNNFSVGGSLSVNCHGWEPDRAIASTVESLRLMKADGEVVTCSRAENPELFSLVLGGYGLFGVILDVDLKVVANERYQPETRVVDTDQYVAQYHAGVDSREDVGMVYGRMCVAPEDAMYLKKTILTVFRKSPCRREEIPGLGNFPLATLRRQVYRAQIGSAEGKADRWRPETTLGEQMSGMKVSRNSLLNEDVDAYLEQSSQRTEVLQEYFVPEEQFEKFIGKMREIVRPGRGPDLLNVTIRNLHEDKDSFLRYADTKMFAFVLLFNQERTGEADARTGVMTRELIEAALACGGRYYLPYRAHATRDQFYRAYPEATRFFELKRNYDPDEIFQNKWYLEYGTVHK